MLSYKIKLKFVHNKINFKFVCNKIKLKFTDVLNVSYKIKLSYVIIQDKI